VYKQYIVRPSGEVASFDLQFDTIHGLNSSKMYYQASQQMLALTGEILLNSFKRKFISNLLILIHMWIY